MLGFQVGGDSTRQYTNSAVAHRSRTPTNAGSCAHLPSNLVLIHRKNMSNVQTQGVETLQVNLSREHQGVPWGFRLTGGRDFANALAIQLVSVYFPIAQLGHPRNISIPSDAWLVKSCMLLLGYKDAKLRWKPSNYSLMSIRKFCVYNYSFNPGIFTLLLFVLYTVRFHCRRTPLGFIIC